MQKIFAVTLLVILSAVFAGCGYTPEQRGVSGAALGGATGAAIGAATGGGGGAALAGGALGAMMPMAIRYARRITAIETRQFASRERPLLA